MSGDLGPGYAQRQADRIKAYDAAMAAQHPERHLTHRAIADCPRCDDQGYRNGHICDHIDRTDTYRNGIAACLQALGKPLNPDPEQTT